MPMTADITKAVAILKEGGLVAFPTETVYGLGADARSETAVRKIFAAKERPYNHPLIVHLASPEMITDWARDIPESAWLLAKNFWPGPLTLILKKQPHVLDVITGGQDTIGLRIPRHPIAQALLSGFAGGVAAPSANKFTHVSPTTAQAVEEELGKDIDLILEGGACEVGLESTILDLSGDKPMLLRPGMISVQELTQALQQTIMVPLKSQTETRAPGMHDLHYAPMTTTILLSSDEVSSWVTQHLHEKQTAAVLVRAYDFEKLSNYTNEQTHLIKMPDDAKAYAHDLYHQLRSADHQEHSVIIITDIPTYPEWDAIRDRILKATAVRHYDNYQNQI